LWASPKCPVQELGWRRWTEAAERFSWRAWESCGWLGDFRGRLKINDFVSRKQNVSWGWLGATAPYPRLQNLPGPRGACRNHPGLKWRRQQRWRRSAGLQVLWKAVFFPSRIIAAPGLTVPCFHLAWDGRAWCLVLQTSSLLRLRDCVLRAAGQAVPRRAGGTDLPVW